MKKRILVAGGAGDLGHRLCQFLAENNFEVYALDNLSSSDDSRVQWGPLIKRDTRETGPITQALKKEKIEAVIQCAFLHDLAGSTQKPDAYYDNNLGGTMSLLKAIQAAGIKNFIFSTDKSASSSPYAESLKMCEQVLQDAQNAYGLNIQFVNSAQPEDYLHALEKMSHG